ncbi:Probably inactive leucine-rich repeat receptor-like protein kinase [Striga hermonthica]|uniref:Probably inactive leucine-rich repeat receptor-like protein kinase n=1 Tax=Striga hermonthica TaxID=68872 RepID=A0A9N7RS66_STRHE|nr:Probably inactive leucine-rich repeat receptor-like protein kinase [Striga hermonthica]
MATSGWSSTAGGRRRRRLRERFKRKGVERIQIDRDISSVRLPACLAYDILPIGLHKAHSGKGPIPRGQHIPDCSPAQPHAKRYLSDCLSLSSSSSIEGRRPPWPTDKRELARTANNKNWGASRSNWGPSAKLQDGALFSGEIPANLANCTFLSTLKLDNNRLTGQIPSQIGQLGRLKSFSVARNQLTGPVPNFYNFSSIGADSYMGNPGLCGGPGLHLCQDSADPRTFDNPTIIGAAAGGPLGFTIGIWCYLYFTGFTNKKKQKVQKQKQQQRESDPLCNKWAKGIKRAEHVKISMLGKSVPKMSFHDLMKATNDFSRENIIGSGSTGTTYKAVLQDGTSFLVKRLQNIRYTEKGFASEVVALGNMKHRNVTPLIGFCLTKKERLLIYKDMLNGTLHDKLHILNVGDQIMHWPLRLEIAMRAAKGFALEIAIRAAKGFAWLHSMGLIHGDINPKCILLDEGYEPRIYDFLLTNRSDYPRLGELITNDGVSTQEGDVYSFGVVLLELVTREKLTDTQYYLEFTSPSEFILSAIFSESK